MWEEFYVAVAQSLSVVLLHERPLHVSVCFPAQVNVKP